MEKTSPQFDLVGFWSFFLLFFFSFFKMLVIASPFINGFKENNHEIIIIFRLPYIKKYISCRLHFLYYSYKTQTQSKNHPFISFTFRFFPVVTTHSIRQFLFSPFKTSSTLFVLYILYLPSSSTPSYSPHT